MTDEPDVSRSAAAALSVAAKLRTEAAALVTAVSGLAKSVDALAQRMKRSERAIAFIVASLILDVILTLVVGYLIYGQYNTQKQLHAICPLYAFSLGTYAPLTRSAGPDRDAYIQRFEDMRHQFQIFGCGPDYPLVPGAAHPPNATAVG